MPTQNHSPRKAAFQASRPGILTQLHQRLATRASKLLHTLLPQNCFLCLASSQGLLCPDCTADLPSLPAGVCPRCAHSSPEGLLCGDCLRHPPHFDASYACLRYDFPIDRLIQALKYGHRLAVSRELGGYLSTHSAVSAVDIDMILALPLSSQRLAERGYNQALELARPLARHLARPLLIHGYQRLRHTTAQASLPWQDRQKNIRNAFHCDLDLRGKRVLVIDDVMTTGATLNEFARTLKAAGAAWVGNQVLARALRQGAD